MSRYARCCDRGRISMRIPVFVSAPTVLSAVQQSSYDVLLDHMEKLGLERRALGRSDYPAEYPLKEVYQLARRCSGGMILGFIQQRAPSVVSKPGTSSEKKHRDVSFPTPWNHLEAGILFGLRLPLLVFREDGVNGGIFDVGASDIFIPPMPRPTASGHVDPVLMEVILNWQGRVRHHYDKWDPDCP